MKNVFNIEIYMMDYVGHGMSSGTRGHFDNFEVLVKDQLAFIKNISIKNDQDVIMLGHGLGGLVTVEMYNKYSHIMTKKPHKLILSNFILNLDHSILNVKIKHSFLINKFTKSLKLINLFDANKMSNSGDAVLANFQDPLYVHRPTLNAIVEINTKAKLIYQEAYFLDIPIMVGWGKQDPYVSILGMNYFIKGIKKNLLFEKTYSHMKHDLYNEVDSSIFYNDIKNWIENEN
jgi:alpha-beta hydrolase superfamily lysophospholipase